MITIEILVMLGLLLAARFLIPKMLNSDSVGMKYGIGVSLFAIYTAVSLLMFRYFCSFDGKGIAQLTGSEVWSRVVCSFLLVNLAMVMVSVIYYFARDKRKLSQEEKMKLKDL